MTQAQEQRIKAPDGHEIYVRVWPADEPKATILLAHGLGEHSARYDHVAARLNQEGWTVISPDHRGHGKSAGGRGHVLRWGEYVADLDIAAHKLADAKLPMALIGHSMGGLIAVHFALRHPDRIKALVLSGPLLKVAAAVPPLKAALGRVMSNVFPSLTLPSGLDSKAISRDADVVKAYETDKLVHDKVSTRWFTEMLSAINAAHERAAELRMPVLLFHGGSDRLTAIEGSRLFFNALEVKDRHFKEWPGLFHEIFNEPEQNQVFDEMVAWIKPYLSA